MRLPLLALAATLVFALSFQVADFDAPTPERRPEDGSGVDVAPEASVPDEAEEDEEAGPIDGETPFPSTETTGSSVTGALRLVVELRCAETGRLLVPGRVVEEELGALSPGDRCFEQTACEWDDFGYECLEFEIDPPSGYTMEDLGSNCVTVHRSRYAKELRVRLVAWPEADLRVVVKEPDGRASAGAVVGLVHMPRWSRTVSARTDSLGVARIPGVPAIPGEPFRIIAAKDDREAGSAKVRMNRSTEETWATVVLPAEPGRASIYRGPSGCVPGSRRWPRYPEPQGSAALRIVLRRVDGRPAPETYVVARGRDGEKIIWRTRGKTDAEGVLLLDDLPGGAVDVRVFEDGFLMAEARPVEVHAGTTTDLVIREDRGVPLTIRVTDPRGRAIGGVEITLDPAGADDFTWVDGDVQHAGLFTGPDGTLRVPRLPEGKVGVKARLGSREKRERVDTGSECRLVIPD